MSIKVLVADDHQIIREGLRSLIGSQSDMELVADACDGYEAVQQIRKLLPEVVIMDFAMPNLNGAEATRQIMAEFPDIKVIALSMYSDKRYVTAMLKAGASGYLLKDCAFEEVSSAVRTVAGGKIYLGSGVNELVIGDYIRYLSEDSPESPALSDREREVLQLLAEGRSTKEAAARLYVSVKTIETHRKNIMDKLDIHSIANLTKYAIRQGLTTMEG